MNSFSFRLFFFSGFSDVFLISQLKLFFFFFLFAKGLEKMALQQLTKFLHLSGNFHQNIMLIRAEDLAKRHYLTVYKQMLPKMIQIITCFFISIQLVFKNCSKYWKQGLGSVDLY